MPIPLTVVVLKINDRLIMMDAGSGVGQWQTNATHLPANMAAAGIDYKAIDTIMISHFHPDHVWGLMEKGTNTPVFPNAELVVNADRIQLVDRSEPAWKSCPKAASRPASASPKISRNGRTGSWSRTAPRSRPAFRSSLRPATRPAIRSISMASGNEQIMVSADTMYVPALLAPHPEWQGSYDQDGPDGNRHPSQADRPGDRRQHQDLRLALPVPGNGHLREGRQRLWLHAGRPGLTQTHKQK